MAGIVRKSPTAAVLLIATILLASSPISPCLGATVASVEAQSERNAAGEETSLPPKVTERDVLRSLYTWTDGASWSTSTNWLSGESYCDWFGITCTTTSLDGSQLPEPCVEQIDLSGNSLKGILPVNILLRLPCLRTIKLDGNSLDLAPTSEAMSEHEVELFGKDYHDAAAQPIISPCQWLDLSHNDMGDARDLFRTIFRTYSGREIHLPGLTDFYLAGTHLSGSLSAELIAEMPKLERLTLDMNDLDGNIPVQLGNLGNLRVLSLRDNKFVGQLPESLGQLRKLRFLSLRGNQLTGALPAELSNEESMPFLEHLDLSRQKEDDRGVGWSSSVGLSGKLPSFGSQTNLRQLDLSFNSFSGPVPSDFLASVNPSSFDYAFLGNNDITGTVPASALIRLPPDAIFLEDNRISGLADAICAPGRGGAVASFGCDAILCRPGTYGPDKGRQEDASGPCRDCPNAKFWGASQCIAVSDGPPPAPEPAAPATSPETEILLKFYDATGGPNWKKKYGWADAANADATNRRADVSSFCGWFGITCAPSEETVTAINLEWNNLVGSPPKELYQLKNLRTLVLAKNTIEFHFDGIANARSLTELDLRDTSLYSTAGISAAAGWLRELHLDSNPLTDDAIAELLDLTIIENLSLDDCEITGSMSDNIGLLTKLVSFSASNNQITGDLPKGLANCKDLSTLRLRSNRMSGPFPTVLSELKSLSVIDLSEQRSETGEGGLTGPLPPFSAKTALSRLDLSGNAITGTIPENFLEAIADNKPPNYEFVDLSSNLLGGTVPKVIASIPNVYLQDNRFTEIDPEVCDAVKGTPMESFGCDAVLCAPGTHNALGRQQSSDNPCMKCDIGSSSQYYGSIDCVQDSGGTGAPPITPGAGSATEQLTTEEILRKIYTSCSGAKWTDSTNWLKDGAPICTWKGISCSSNGDVTNISLRSNHLDGLFPTEVFNIKTLTSLILEGNSIDFRFEGIENAVALASIDLSQTGLSSVDGIERASGLRELYLTNNNLRGPFPSRILQLKGLEKLSIAFNALTSALPDDFGSLLGQLRFIDLNQNNLEGRIPSSLPLGLEVLLMSGNKLSGEIPDAINSLDKLRFVDLAEQDSPGGGLTGPIPNLANLPDIKRVDFSSNALTGTMPIDFLNSVTPQEDFDYIDFTSNQLTGRVPGSLSKFDVDTIYLADNKFTAIANGLCSPALGSLQAEFGCNAVLCPPQTYNEEGKQKSKAESCDPCPSAQYFGTISCGNQGAQQPTRAPTFPNLPPVSALSEDKILARMYDKCGGPRWNRSDNWKTDANVCTWFGVRCSPDGSGGVVSIMLSANNLIGTPPEELFQLPDLQSLVLDNNKILFDFKGIERARKLNNIDLSGIGLYSVEGISNAPSIKVLNLASNSLEGPPPPELFMLESLEQLTLDFNSLHGPLPTNVQAKNLELLSMASNDLTGEINPSITSLTKLLTLRLQNNALNGTLPSALDKMTSLIFVDLSHQVKTRNAGFTGLLPSLVNLEKLRRIDLSSNSLSGQIPDDFLAGVSTIFEYADLSSNRLSGEIPPDLSRIDNLYLQDNFITDIDVYCSLVTSDAVQQYGCDAVLCPPNTYNKLGRQSSEDSGCVPCEWAQYYGVTECVQGSSGSSSGGVVNTPVAAPTSAEAEKQVLAKLYEACGGYNWNDNKNWQSTSSFCNWKGIQCLEGGGETVQAINLGANNLRGTPPPEIFDLPNLEMLTLYSNPLTGFNFNGIEKAKRLKEIYLDQTGLTSVDGIGMAPSLTTLNLRFNSLQGSFPSDILQVKTLKSINLSHNKLEGPLPTTVAMSNLETLILSSNSFQGELSGVVFPPSLRILDLSKNELSGSIPTSFLDTIPDSRRLDVDLSENLLTGVVPSSLTRFDEMNLLLASNFIVGIDDTICYKGKWNDGDVGEFGCDAFLCPKGTFAPNGRQTAGNRRCQQCKNGPFWGMSECPGVKYKARGNAAARTTTILSAGLSLVASIVCLWMH